MSKIKSTSVESQKLSELLASKEQIEHFINYYKAQHEANKKIYETLQVKIELGYIETKSLLFGFIPVVKKQVLGELGIKQYQKELINIENNQHINQKHYNFYLQQNAIIDAKIDKITIELNKNFDTVLEQAKTINNPRLSATINTYDDKNTTTIEKIAFYEYLKQEINNSLVYGKPK